MHKPTLGRCEHSFRSPFPFSWHSLFYPSPDPDISHLTSIHVLCGIPYSEHFYNWNHARWELADFCTHFLPHEEIFNFEYSTFPAFLSLNDTPSMDRASSVYPVIRCLYLGHFLQPYWSEGCCGCDSYTMLYIDTCFQPFWCMHGTGTAGSQVNSVFKSWETEKQFSTLIRLPFLDSGK